MKTETSNTKRKLFQSFNGTNNVYEWILAFFPLVLVLIGIGTYWSIISELFDGPMGVVLVILFIAFLIFNWFLVSKDEKVNGLNLYFVWEKLLVPVYLFKRAAKTNKKLPAFFTWIATNWLILLIVVGEIILIDIPLMLIIDHFLPPKMATVISAALVVLSGVVLYFLTDTVVAALVH